MAGRLVLAVMNFTSRTGEMAMRSHIILIAAALMLSSHPATSGDGNVYLGPSPTAPGWARIDPASWSPNKAATAAELVGALLAGPLESLEGNPDVKVHVWKSGETFRAAVKALNLLDDSVKSEEIVIEIKQAGNGFVVSEVWKRWVCRRGDSAGNWTSKLCP
jgi:hypothetical protein